MFERVRDFFRKADPLRPEACLQPPHYIRYRAWCVIPDGRVAYIDHYKSDGKFGVRPIDFKSGLMFPNTSEHWSEKDRLRVPEEVSLSLGEIRAAEPDDIPLMWRKS